MNILITGATGLVGRELGKELVRRGHRIFAVSRSRKKALLQLPFPAYVIEGDLSVEPLRDDYLREIEAVVHLAGENISEKKWSEAQKRKIYDSRVKSSQNLIASLQDKVQLRAFVTASAVGFYGDQADEILDEDSLRGSGFLSEVCQDWEMPVIHARKKQIWPNTRSVILRFPFILAPHGGGMEKLMDLFSRGLGGRIATGKQWMSWIHIDDLVQLVVKVLQDKQSPELINAVAPEVVTNLQFSQQMAEIFNRRMGPPVPRVAMTAMMGEMAHVILDSQRVQSKVLPAMNFKFKFPELRGALQDVCRWRVSGDEVIFSEQFIPFATDKIFPFFANAKNLGLLTPASLKFQIKSMSTEPMAVGTLIQYKMKIHQLPIRWITKITEWSPPFRFADLQVKGPYKKWQHTHLFEPLAEGTLMTDLVQYRLPMGLMGHLAAGRWVRKDVNSIFKFRREVIASHDFNDQIQVQPS